MKHVTTLDGTSLFVKEWGAGRPVFFSHGWPLNADAWDEVMFAVASAGYRAVAHDRRGHGRSDQPSDGHDMDTYADDLAEIIETIDLADAVLVGHSTGGGEVVRYLARHGAGRVARAVLLGAVPPLMVRTEDNPGGEPPEAFDRLRAAVLADRSQFFRDSTPARASSPHPASPMNCSPSSARRYPSCTIPRPNLVSSARRCLTDSATGLSGQQAPRAIRRNSLPGVVLFQQTQARPDS